MTWFIGLLAVVGAIMLVLAVALAVEFLRLGRELRQVGEDTGSMLKTLRRSTRTLQVVIPLAIAVRGWLGGVYKRVRSHVKKESV